MQCKCYDALSLLLSFTSDLNYWFSNKLQNVYNGLICTVFLKSNSFVAIKSKYDTPRWGIWQKLKIFSQWIFSRQYWDGQLLRLIWISKTKQDTRGTLRCPDRILACGPWSSFRIKVHLQKILTLLAFACPENLEIICGYVLMIRWFIELKFMHFDQFALHGAVQSTDFLTVVIISQCLLIMQNFDANLYFEKRIADNSWYFTLWKAVL